MIIGVGEGEHFSLTPNILALRKRDNAQTGTVLAKLTPKLKNRHFWKKTFYRFTLHPTLKSSEMPMYKGIERSVGCS